MASSESTLERQQRATNQPNESEGQSGAPDRSEDVFERLRKLHASMEQAQNAGAASSRIADRRAPAAGEVPVAEALQRLARLNEEQRARSFPFEQPAAKPETEAKPAVRVPQRSTGGVRISGRVIKSVLAIVVAIALAWVPVTRLLTTRSAEATVNARLVNLRAPIDGTVEVVAPSLTVGTSVDPGEPLLRISNLRADRQRLDDLRRTERSLQAETKADAAQLASLEELGNQLKAQYSAFQEGRVRQLEARHDKLAADVKGAEAERADAEKSVKRSQDLNKRGVQTIATLLHAERDLKVAVQKVAAAKKLLEGNEIELEGARKGFFVGDSYNDVPRSAQRLNEVEHEIVTLKGKLDQNRSRLAFLAEDIATESKLFDRHSEATVKATVKGRIWEVLTANGEEARSGQDLLRILDCSAAVVTATVSESVYNSLWVGQPVSFRLRGASNELPGSVAALTGLTPAGANLAIQQSALSREPYHVTIAVPALAARRDCSVGRTGGVTFDTAAVPPQRMTFPSAQSAPARSWGDTASDAWKTAAKYLDKAKDAAIKLADKAKKAIEGSKPATDAP